MYSYNYFYALEGHGASNNVAIPNLFTQAIVKNASFTWHFTQGQ